MGGAGAGRDGAASAATRPRREPAAEAITPSALCPKDVTRWEAPGVQGFAKNTPVARAPPKTMANIAAPPPHCRASAPGRAAALDGFVFEAAGGAGLATAGG